MNRTCPLCDQAVKRIKLGREYALADADNKDRLLNYHGQGNVSYSGQRKRFYLTNGGTYAIHKCKAPRPNSAAVQWDKPADLDKLRAELARTSE